MAAITIQVPDSLLLANEGSLEKLEQRSRFLLALKYFEIGHLSSGQAAGMCAMNRADFLLKAGRSGSPVTDLTEVHRAKYG